MPKLIDNYILEDKIGAGQFGDVFKGHHKQTMQQVAIKSIRRETIKGKFYELLQNEIRVLKTCDNTNIIKLYEIKKTANHFYLMMEYCNQGDMLAYVRKLGTVPEQKVIKFFCQILNAFQDLVKHKIMHRDFKLANILLHEGNVKIADFGFAKLLGGDDYATTMLGSPLNMAPEVLGNNKYNSKADIWSIGACIWQMLYGKPPYIANNMVDLLNLIKTKPLKFPTTPKISQPLKDVLRKMLVPDSKRRISWTQLFNHPINTYLAQQLREEINLQLVEDESLMINTSKFYLKKNLVMESSEQIQQKEKMNQYLLGVLKNGKKQQYKVEQPITKHKKSQTVTTLKSETQQKPAQKPSSKAEKSQKPKQPKQPVQSKSQSLIAPPSQNSEQIQKSLLQLSFRNNIKNIMHYRNIYVFLANVSDEMLTPACFDQFDISYKDSEVIAYAVVLKILRNVKWLISAIQSKNCLIQSIQNWDLFYSSKELAQITDYVKKQLEVFTVFKESIEPNIKNGISTGQYGPEYKPLLSGTIQSQNYEKFLKKYIKSMLKQVTVKMLAMKKIQPFKPALKHIQFCLIAVDTAAKFGNKQFNFNQFYESYNKVTVEELLLRIQKFVKEI